MNKLAEKYYRDQLKQGLSKLKESSLFIFKRMYSHKDLNKPINDVVDEMPCDKLDWALTQVHNSLKKEKLMKK